MSAYPGNYAVPGSFQPGAAWPGAPLASPARWTYTGTETLTYIYYIDTGAGHTLLAVPGGTYSIRPAALGLPPAPDDGLWNGTAP